MGISEQIQIEAPPGIEDPTDGGGGGTESQKEIDNKLNSCITNAVATFKVREASAREAFITRVGAAVATAAIAGLAASLRGGRFGVLVALAVFGIQLSSAVMDLARASAYNEDQFVATASKCFGAARGASRTALIRATRDANAQLQETLLRTIRDVILMRSPILFPPIPPRFSPIKEE